MLISNIASVSAINLWSGGGRWAINPYQTSGDSDNVRNNEKLQDFKSDGFINTVWGGGDAARNALIEFARDLKNLFYVLATIFFLIISLRLILASNTEEELDKFKKWIIWITIGLIVMQIAFAFVNILYLQDVGASLGARIINNIVIPLVYLIQTLASIFFIAMAIFAFYRIVTANGNEEAIKSGKMTIVYALIGFIIVKLARTIVEAFYGRLSCVSTSGGGYFTGWGPSKCTGRVDVAEGVDIIIHIINWLNGFVAIAVTIMILYVGAQLMLSGGDDEKVSKAKRAIIYIVIGGLILVANYLLLTFFLAPEARI